MRLWVSPRNSNHWSCLDAGDITLTQATRDPQLSQQVVATLSKSTLISMTRNPSAPSVCSLVQSPNHYFLVFFVFLNCLPSSARRRSFSVSPCSFEFRLAMSSHRSQAILYRPTLVNLISSIKFASHTYSYSLVVRYFPVLVFSTKPCILLPSVIFGISARML